MRTRVHAAHILPMTAPPVRDGWVDVDDGRIVAIGSASTAGVEPPPACTVDLGSVAVLPGLINTHTHLELAHLGGRVPPATQFVEWVRALLAARDASPTPDLAAMAAALGAAVSTGTVAVGDIGNSLAAVPVLHEAGVFACHFHELLGFRAGHAEARARDAWSAAAQRGRDVAAGSEARIRFGVAPHAPYSTAPELITAIVNGLQQDPRRRASLHLGESREELQLLRDGTGPWRTMLEAFGTWEPTWQVPRCSPVRYLDQLGALHPNLLLVHGTQLTRDDLAILAEHGSTLVLCPRSNAWVGVGSPPVDDVFASGVRVALGTDSLTSVADMNLFEELAAMRRLAPAVPASALLRAATVGGAEALGFPTLGAIAPGFSSCLLVASVPADADPADWLVGGGVGASEMRWLDECLAADVVSGVAP